MVEYDQKYDGAAEESEDVRCSFTPMHGLFNRCHWLSRTASVLGDKWSRLLRIQLYLVKNFVLVQTEFAMLRAVSMKFLHLGRFCLNSTAYHVTKPSTVYMMLMVLISPN